MIDNAFDAVVAAVAALAANPEPTAWEGYIVKDDEDALGRYLIEGGCLPDRFAAVIHKGLRLHQQALDPAEREGGGHSLELYLVYLNAVFVGKQVGKEEARVVAGQFILLAGVAKPHDDEFGRAGYRRSS